MKKLLTRILTGGVLMLFSGCSSHFLTEQFNENWTYQRLSAPDTLSGLAVRLGSGLDHGEPVALPHTANIEPMLVNDMWQGICYYQKRFELPADGKRRFLKFDAAMNEADIWLNGQHISHHLGGFLPFTIDITSYAKKDNLLIVRLDNRDNPMTGPKPLRQLDYCMYGGLYRNVWLMTRGEVYISEPLEVNKPGGGGIMVATETVSSASATVKVTANIMDKRSNKSPMEIEFAVINPEGKEVASEKIPMQAIGKEMRDVTHKFSITSPQLWTPETPYIYTLRTKVLSNGKLQDEKYTRFGIRDLKIVNHKLYINGKERFLHGVNRHQEYPYVGYALSDAAQYRDAYKIKKAGFDYIRLSHYPQSEAFLNACDELGILVLDAISGWQYFNEDEAFKNFTLQASRDMIRRDRNHPCILAWEVSLNETTMPEGFMHQLHGLAKEETPHMYTAGWMRNGGYDIYIESRQYRMIYKDIDRNCPYIVSEYGDWEYLCLEAGKNQDGISLLPMGKRHSRYARSTDEPYHLQQVWDIQEGHNDNRGNTGAFADGYWVMCDYNSGFDDNLEHSGVMDLMRLPKLSYYYTQSQRPYISGNAFAPYRVKIAALPETTERDEVVVFSNCDEIELFVDGKSIGKQHPDQNAMTTNVDNPTTTFRFPRCKMEKMKAVGYVAGKPVMEDEWQAAGKAVKLMLRADVDDVAAQRGANDAIFVYASVTDASGVPVRNYKGKVRFAIEGDGQIIPTDEIELEGGIATILVRIGKDNKKIKVTGTTEGLKNGVCLF